MYHEVCDGFSETSVVICQTTRRHFLYVMAAVESSYFKITNPFWGLCKRNICPCTRQEGACEVGEYSISVLS